MICYRGYWYSWKYNPKGLWYNLFIRKGERQWTVTIPCYEVEFELLGYLACAYIDQLIERQ